MTRSQDIGLIQKPSLATYLRGVATTFSFSGVTSTTPLPPIEESLRGGTVATLQRMGKPLPSSYVAGWIPPVEYLEALTQEERDEFFSLFEQVQGERRKREKNYMLGHFVLELLGRLTVIAVLFGVLLTNPLIGYLSALVLIVAQNKNMWRNFFS